METAKGCVFIGLLVNGSNAHKGRCTDMNSLVSSAVYGFGAAFSVLAVIAIANGLSSYVLRDKKTLTEVITDRLGA